MFAQRIHRIACDRRRAFTLVELLVAVTISLLLVAIAIPALKLNMRGQAVREAARQINSFIDEARSQAAGSGRPFGVMIERDGDGSYGNPRRSFRLYHVETPPPYCGDLMPSTGNPDNRLACGSRAYIESFDTNPFLPTPPSPANTPNPNYRIGFAVLTYSSHRLVNPGDGISFDGRSEKFLILQTADQSSASNPNSRLRITFYHPTAAPPANLSSPVVPVEAPPADLDSPYNPSAPFPPILAGHSFQVTRQPVKIASSVLELPRSAAIDLDWSCYGAGGIQFFAINTESGTLSSQWALSPITILFSPTGEVKSVTAPWQQAPNRYALKPEAIAEPIYFLVGRLDQVEDGFTPGANWTISAAEIKSNVMDPESLWIKINPASGMTLTVENIGPANRDPVTSVEIGMPAATDRGIGALNARALARMSAGAGG